MRVWAGRTARTGVAAAREASNERDRNGGGHGRGGAAAALGAGALELRAGYVDVYTFLALFGLFVAQVTGSFVTAGAQFVIYDIGFAGKVIAIFAFCSRRLRRRG